jgi:oligoendopeptidase F
MDKLTVKSTEWNLNPLFRSDDDPSMQLKRKDVEKKSYDFINKWSRRDDYLKDPAILKDAFDEYEQWVRFSGSSGDEGYYLSLRSSQDQNDPRLKAKASKLNEFSQRIENDIQFFEHKVAKIPVSQQGKFLDHPGLEKYRHFLEMCFANAKYLLTEPEEKILNLKSQTSFANWVKMTSGFIAKEERKILSEDGKKEVKSFSEIMSLMDSKKKAVRDNAAAAFNDILIRHIDAAEAEMNSILEDKKIDDELRKIKRPDMGRHIADDIDTDCVDSLLEAVSGKYGIAKRYYQLKAKLFKVKRLKYHERNIEYGRVTKKYPYPDALNLVYKVFLGLDPEFAGILKRMNSNGQIDVYPKKGKVHGAFCSDGLISQPTYVLLNHDDSLNDVLTIAHEMGHAINSELMKGRQTSLSYDTPLSTAEAASTFMEDFVLQEVVKEMSEEARLSIMMMKLNSDISSIFRQVACYRFEQELHARYRELGYLSKEQIGESFQKHMASYMGDSVEMSKGSENWWVYWSHIRHFFYVYSYASGLLISKSLQGFVKKDPVFIVKVKEFLAAGESDSPKNIFKRMGIDIADRKFWDKGLCEVESLLDETERLAERLGKI